MRLIVYTSKSEIPYERFDEEYQQICSTSAKNNDAKGITGVLLHHNGCFIQALEGDSDQLNELVEVIKRDQRHSRYATLFDCDVENRSFADWSMKGLDLDKNTDIDPIRLVEFAKLYQSMVRVTASDFIDMMHTFLLSIEQRADAVRDIDDPSDSAMVSNS